MTADPEVTLKTTDLHWLPVAAQFRSKSQTRVCTNPLELLKAYAPSQPLSSSKELFLHRHPCTPGNHSPDQASANRGLWAISGLLDFLTQPVGYWYNILQIRAKTVNFGARQTRLTYCTTVVPLKVNVSFLLLLGNGSYIISSPQPKRLPTLGLACPGSPMVGHATRYQSRDMLLYLQRSLES